MKKLFVIAVVAFAALTGCGSDGSVDQIKASDLDYHKVNIGGVTCIVATDHYLITCDWDSYDGGSSSTEQTP